MTLLLVFLLLGLLCGTSTEVFSVDRVEVSSERFRGLFVSTEPELTASATQYDNDGESSGRSGSLRKEGKLIRNSQQVSPDMFISLLRLPHGPFTSSDGDLSFQTPNFAPRDVKSLRGKDTDDVPAIWITLAQRGLDYVKDVLLTEVLESVVPIQLPDITKKSRVPFVGEVTALLSNITLVHAEVPLSTIALGELGLCVQASDVVANLTLRWQYDYHNIWLPAPVTDSGGAYVNVLGMQAGISVSIQQHMGTIWMDVLQSGTYIDTVQVQLNGGSSWLYQWLVDSLEEWMRTTIEEQLNEQIQQCIQNLNSFLLQTPQQVHVDDVSELNFTVVTEPIVNPTSLSIGIKGEFISTRLSKFGPQHSLELPSGLVCDGDATMVTIALSESILKDGAAIYYNADFLNWLVDQSPVQALLNTTKWKFLIPQLYQKYPNKEIKLQFEVSNPPNVSLTLDGIDVYVTAKMIIGVADNNTNIEAACISIALSGSGIADINGNNITGHLVLNNLCLDLEWSSVGAIHLKLVEVFLRTLVKDFLLPFLNVSLKRGFPLPVIPSMKLKNSAVNYGNGFLLVCSDIEYVKGYPGNLN